MTDDPTQKAVDQILAGDFSERLADENLRPLWPSIRRDRDIAKRYVLMGLAHARAALEAADALMQAAELAHVKHHWDGAMKDCDDPLCPLAAAYRAARGRG